MKPTTQIHFRKIDPEILKAMRDECKRRGMKQRPYVIEALKKYAEISKRLPGKEQV